MVRQAGSGLAVRPRVDITEQVCGPQLGRHIWCGPDRSAAALVSCLSSPATNNVTTAGLTAAESRYPAKVQLQASTLHYLPLAFLLELRAGVAGAEVRGGVAGGWQEV